MANTQLLKTKIEPELAGGFLLAHDAVRIAPGPLLGMQPDLVAYSIETRILWVCEITVSGFLGKGDALFHVGASRKFCEGFAKFSILNRLGREAKNQIAEATHTPHIVEARMECRFVVPTGSRFIQALGWRKQLVGTIMQVEEIELSPASREEMIQVLLASRLEQQATTAVAS